MMESCDLEDMELGDDDLGVPAVVQTISDQYELVEEKPSPSMPDDKAAFYRADQPVSSIAQELANIQQPQRMTTSNDDAMLLEYPEGLVDIRRDDVVQGASIIGLMSMYYAANNYVRSDFAGNGYLNDNDSLDILDDLFERKKYSYTGSGSSGGGHYSGGGWFRGGGPSAGK